MPFPSGKKSLSSAVNTGASLNSGSCAPALELPAGSQAPWRGAVTQQRRQQRACRAQGKQLLGASRSTLRLHGAVAGHLSRSASLAFPILGRRAGLQGHGQRQRLARTGCAVDRGGLSMDQPKVRSRPAGTWVFLLLRYTPTRICVRVLVCAQSRANTSMCACAEQRALCRIALFSTSFRTSPKKKSGLGEFRNCNSVSWRFSLRFSLRFSFFFQYFT